MRIVAACAPPLGRDRRAIASLHEEDPMDVGTNLSAIPGSNRPPRPGTRTVGKCDETERIKVSIYARRNPAPAAGSAPSIAALTSALPADRKYLDAREFDAVYGADPADIEAIAAWAVRNHLTVLERDPRKRRVLVEGTIGDINAAFHVTLTEFEHPGAGRYRGREGKIYVPSELFGVVTGVFGLDNRRLGRPRYRNGRAAPLDVQHLAKAAPGHAAPLANPFPGTFFPPQLAQLYDFPPALSGSGQNIAIFAFNGHLAQFPQGDPHGGYKLAALKNYFEHVLGGTTPAIKDVVVHGKGNLPGPDTAQSGQMGDATGEVMLDMCVVGAMAPGAKIFMYFTEFTSQGWVDAVHQALTDGNDIGVISISYGHPEDDPAQLWTPMSVKLVNEAFEAAVAKGVTICVASGDDGSGDGEDSGAHVDFPASSPFVLGVGGTKLVATNGGNPPAIAQETVWNETFRDEGSGGGGVSEVFTKPPYQAGVNVPPSANPPHPIGRGVPDVSAVADPETGVVRMRVDGKHLEPTGGTSASAPLWAALVARLNQGLNARCGFLNTLLYTKFATGVLRDITDGNNGAYEARPGWDACTGLGSPQGERLLQALSGKPIAKNVSAGGAARSRTRRAARAN
jgi:kumamolisin